MRPLDARRRLLALDWRLHDVVLSPVPDPPDGIALAQDAPKEPART